MVYVHPYATKTDESERKSVFNKVPRPQQVVIAAKR